MEDEWRKRRWRNNPPSFEKEEEDKEVKCDNSDALFVPRADEEKAGAVREAISALMKRHGAEMRDEVEAAAKEVRAGFIEAVKAAVEDSISNVRDESELSRSRDAEEAARVAENDDSRRRSQDEEETSSYVRKSVADDILAAADNKVEGGRLRALE